MIHILFFTAGLMAASASAHAKHASDNFRYVGCVQAKSCAFPVKMDLGDSFTIAQCQQACGKNNSYAAAARSGCHCADPVAGAAPEYTVTDDSRCSRPCKPGDDKAGHCGSPTLEDGYQLYNVYQRVATQSAVPNVTLPDRTDKPVGDATSVIRNTAATHAPKTRTEEPHATSVARDNAPAAVESTGGVACSNCTAPLPPASTASYRHGENRPAASLPSDHCPGGECRETEIPAPPSSKAAPAATASNPSHSVIVSEGPSRPANAITVALGMAALVLAVGMS